MNDMIEFKPMKPMRPIPAKYTEKALGDIVPDSVKEFERNFEKAHPGAVGHNIYHIVAEDLDGNVVDEHFGVNIMTDWAFARKHDQSSSGYGYINYMYLGDGEWEGELDPASTSMVHLIGNTSATMTDTNFTHAYTRWHPEKESNLVRYRLCIGYFDYTVWSEDHTVTEIGLCFRDNSSTTALAFHAAIYDSEGQKSSFVKKVNQKLTITVYCRIMVPIVKIVNSSWDRGIPCVTNSYGFCQLYSYHNWYVMCSHFNPYDWHDNWYDAWYLRRHDNGSITDHVYSATGTRGMNIFIDGKYQYISEILLDSYWDDGNSCQYGSHFIFATKLKMDEPIPFETINFRTISYGNSSFVHTYAWRNRDTTRDAQGQLPMTDIHVTSLSMYNGQTDDWDIDVPVYEPIPYLEAGLEHLRLSIREHNYITFQQAYKWYTVFINEAPEYPIKQIMNAGRTFYVTDTYWDSDTWEIVPNTNSITREQGSKRFFIMFDEQFDYTSADEINHYGNPYKTRRIARYDWTFPRLDVNNRISEEAVNFGAPSRGGNYYSYIYADSTHCGKYVKNETIGYIAGDGFIVYPDDTSLDAPQTDLFSGYQWSGWTKSTSLTGYPHRYSMGGINLSATPGGYQNDGTYPGLIWNTPRGTHIANCGYYSWSQGVRVYTPSSDPTEAPTYENFRFDAAWSDTPTMTDTQNGYVVFSYTSGANNANCTYVLEYDVEGVAPNMYKVEGYHHAWTIELTNYFVAIDSSVSDHLHLVVYDMANREVHAEFDLPAGYTFQGGTGWKDYVYVRVDQSGATSTFIYYINRDMYELTPLNIPQMRMDGSAWWSHIRRCNPTNGNIESCMILIASDRDTGNENHVFFRESDPTKAVQLIRNEQYETSNYVRWQKAELTYSPDNKQLILAYAGRRTIVVDFGWIIKHGTLSTHLTWPDLYQESSTQYCPVYYKGFIYYMQMYYREHWDSQWRFRNRYWRSPIQNWLNMKLVGTTYTPNSMMNPVRIQGNFVTWLYQDTNRGTDVAPEPYVPPQEEESPL